MESPDGVKVMVIDDSKTIRKTAETLLKKESYEVITAIDGFEALAKIARHKPPYHFRGYHDAASGWLSDLRVDQAQQVFSADAGDHAVQQGQHDRQGARPSGRLRAVSDQTFFQ